MAEGSDKMVNEKSGYIQVKDVVKKFTQPDGTEMTALNGVNLEIEPGSFISFIGPSGCGKSTLLRLIAGLDKPTSGELTLDGEPIKKPGYDRGLVFQNPTLFSWLNIYDNIILDSSKVYENQIIY